MKPLNNKHLSFPIKKGDMLVYTIVVDVLVSIRNVQKVTDIEHNGIIRVECIDPDCIMIRCTYLELNKHEMKSLRVDNRYKESKRLSVMMIG